MSRIRYGRKAKEIVAGIESREDLFAKLRMQWMAVERLLDRNTERRSVRYDKALIDSFNVFAALVAEADAVMKEEHKRFRDERREHRISKFGKNTDTDTDK